MTTFPLTEKEIKPLDILENYEEGPKTPPYNSEKIFASISSIPLLPSSEDIKLKSPQKSNLSSTTKGKHGHTEKSSLSNSSPLSSSSSSSSLSSSSASSSLSYLSSSSSLSTTTSSVKSSNIGSIREKEIKDTKKAPLVQSKKGKETVSLESKETFGNILMKLNTITQKTQNWDSKMNEVSGGYVEMRRDVKSILELLKKKDESNLNLREDNSNVTIPLSIGGVEEEKMGINEMAVKKRCVNSRVKCLFEEDKEALRALVLFVKCGTNTLHSILTFVSCRLPLMKEEKVLAISKKACMNFVKSWYEQGLLLAPSVRIFQGRVLEVLGKLSILNVPFSWGKEIEKKMPWDSSWQDLSSYQKQKEKAEDELEVINSSTPYWGRLSFIRWKEILEAACLFEKRDLILRTQSIHSYIKSDKLIKSGQGIRQMPKISNQTPNLIKSPKQWSPIAMYPLCLEAFQDQDLDWKLFTTEEAKNFFNFPSLWNENFAMDFGGVLKPIKKSKKFIQILQEVLRQDNSQIIELCYPKCLAPDFDFSLAISSLEDFIKSSATNNKSSLPSKLHQWSPKQIHKASLYILQTLYPPDSSEDEESSKDQEATSTAIQCKKEKKSVSLFRSKKHSKPKTKPPRTSNTPTKTSRQPSPLPAICLKNTQDSQLIDSLEDDDDDGNEDQDENEDQKHENQSEKHKRVHLPASNLTKPSKIKKRLDLIISSPPSTAPSLEVDELPFSLKQSFKKKAKARDSDSDQSTTLSKNTSRKRLRLNL